MGTLSSITAGGCTCLFPAWDFVCLFEQICLLVCEVCFSGFCHIRIGRGIVLVLKIDPSIIFRGIRSFQRVGSSIAGSTNDSRNSVNIWYYGSICLDTHDTSFWSICCCTDNCIECCDHVLETHHCTCFVWWICNITTSCIPISRPSPCTCSGSSSCLSISTRFIIGITFTSTLCCRRFIIPPFCWIDLSQDLVEESSGWVRDRGAVVTSGSTSAICRGIVLWPELYSLLHIGGLCGHFGEVGGVGSVLSLLEGSLLFILESLVCDQLLESLSSIFDSLLLACSKISLNLKSSFCFIQYAVESCGSG